MAGQKEKNIAGCRSGELEREINVIFTVSCVCVI
jgi:hypothetical protein